MVVLKYKHATCAALLNPSSAEPLVWPSPFKFITELDHEAKALLERALMEANREREKTILKATFYSQVSSPLHSDLGAADNISEELPKGVLDSRTVTPDHVMHCNTEGDYTQVMSLLPPMDATLLAWAINLMADVVQGEHQNKMNAPNIAMIFAPNMTQMANSLTALLHAVQVMNFLKTLILKTIREREESAANAGMCSSFSDSPNSQGDHHSSIANSEPSTKCCEPIISMSSNSISDLEMLFSSSPVPQESDTEDNFHNFNTKGENKEWTRVCIWRQQTCQMYNGSSGK